MTTAPRSTAPNRRATPSVDPDRLHAGRGGWRTAGLALVVGLVVGGGLGALVGASATPSYQARTALSVLPDSVATNDQNNADPTLDPTSYIQGQLVALNGDEVTGGVRDRLNLAAKPDVTSTQVGQTYVVEITATAASRAGALAVARTTASVYTSLRTTRLTSTIDKQLTATNTRLAAVRKQLAAEQRSDKAGAASTPSEIALQNESQRLLSLSGTLSLQLGQVDNVVTVQAPAYAVAPGLSQMPIAIGAGALGGAVLALIVLFGYRRLSPRIGGVGDVAELGVPVLLPVIPRHRTRSVLAIGRSRSVRLLAARLIDEREHRVLVVAGATGSVGTSRTAAAMATAAAARGPVLLMLADDRTSSDVTESEINDEVGKVVPSRIPGVWLLRGAGDLIGVGDADYPRRSAALVEALRRAIDGGWFVVVDAPPMSESDLALDCLRMPGSVAALVVGLGVSRPAHVLSAAELLDARGGRFGGAILNDVPRFGRRRLQPIDAVEPEPNEVLPALDDVAETTSSGADADRSEAREGRRTTVTSDDLDRLMIGDKATTQTGRHR